MKGLRSIAIVGRGTMSAILAAGQLALRFSQVMVSALRDRQRRRTFVIQLYRIGYQSLPVVVLTGLSIGMVLGVQILATLRAFKGETMTGAMVNFALFSQLAPTVTALMVAGRVGSSIAAELGTMKVTEQIDALRTMGTDPIAYLVVPRFLACVLLLPMLTAIAMFAGVYGSAALLVGVYGVPEASYWARSADFNGSYEIISGLVKTVIFGAIIALVSCRKGLMTKGGATGVGESCTEGVVTSSIMILIANFVLTLILQVMRPWFH
jgi:phospholipid/cholesterol/gamma-HCH transport system permease protein